MEASKSPAFPPRVFVRWGDEGARTDEDKYLVADEFIDAFDDGEAVGVYQLVETRVMRVTRELDLLDS